jgi:hypothetical protein
MTKNGNAVLHGSSKTPKCPFEALWRRVCVVAQCFS